MLDSPPPSKRQHALQLLKALLSDLEHKDLSASNAVQRLWRIAVLLSDSELSRTCKNELDGYRLAGLSLDNLKQLVKKQIEEGKLDPNANVDALAISFRDDLPSYRILYLATEFGLSSGSVRMTDAVSAYDELLAQVRKNPRAIHTYREGGVDYVLSASELNRLVSAVKKWAYEQSTELEERLEFGEIPIRAIETTFEFVDRKLFELIPKAAERLIAAYKNLSETNPENWQNVADSCRRVIKDYADAVFPARNEQIGDLIVTEEKYLNRIRAHAQASISSRRQSQHVKSVVELLAELLTRTDNLASRSVHIEGISRYEAERILIYTYLLISDLMIMGNIDDCIEVTSERTNINSATHEELMNDLGLSSKVAAEIVQRRKQRDFASIEELRSISGIGDQTMIRIGTRLTV